VKEAISAATAAADQAGSSVDRRGQEASPPSGPAAPGNRQHQVNSHPSRGDNQGPFEDGPPGQRMRARRTERPGFRRSRGMLAGTCSPRQRSGGAYVPLSPVPARLALIR